MNRETKDYKINDYWGITCTTFTHWNIKLYSIEVKMLTVPWQEVVEAYHNIESKDEANTIFKQLVAKYKLLV